MAYPAKKEKKYTYSDYVKAPDDKRFQLIEGELIMVPAPNVVHQRILRKLGFALDEFTRKQNNGEIFVAPCDVVFDQYNVLQPDISLILNETEDIITDKNIQGAPDLVVEIISPSSAYQDLVQKKKLYAKFGVKEYWLVDPEGKSVEVYVLKGNKFVLKQSLEKEDVLSSSLLPNLKIELASIFSQ